MPGRPPRGRRRSAGFTIIELLIALVIIGAMAMAVAPSLSEVLSDNRQHGAAMEVLKIARHARAQSLLTGTAHMLRFRNQNDAVGSFGLGRIDLIVSMNNKCAENQTRFVQVPRWADMGEFNVSSAMPTRADVNRQVIFLEARLANPTAVAAVAEASVPVTDLRICYQPNGETFSGVGGVPFGPQVQHVLFTVRREINGSERGVSRQILLPVGGNARFR